METPPKKTWLGGNNCNETEKQTELFVRIMRSGCGKLSLWKPLLQVDTVSEVSYCLPAGLLKACFSIS